VVLGVSYRRGWHTFRIHHQEPQNINQLVDVLPSKPAKSEAMSSLSGLLPPSLDTPRPAPRTAPVDAVAGTSRAGALAGLVGVILYAAGVVLPGTAPEPDAPTSQVVAYFVDHRTLLLTGFALQLVAALFLLWFLGQLRTLVAGTGRFNEPAATTTTAAWVMLMTMVAVALLPSIAIIWQGADRTTPELVRLAYDMQTLGTYALPATVAMLSVGVPSLVLWRRRLLPGWLAVLGAIEVAANVVELAGLSQHHGILAGGYADGIGELAWVLWVAAVSVLMAFRLHGNRTVRRV
jgi:hypothetical protein